MIARLQRLEPRLAELGALDAVRRSCVAHRWTVAQIFGRTPGTTRARRVIVALLVARGVSEGEIGELFGAGRRMVARWVAPRPARARVRRRAPSPPAPSSLAIARSLAELRERNAARLGRYA